MPVSCANVSTVVGRNTAAVDDDAEDDESETRSDLDDTQNKFDFSVSADSKDLHNREHEKEDSDPDGNIVVSPELDCDSLKWGIQSQ